MVTKDVLVVKERKTYCDICLRKDCFGNFKENKATKKCYICGKDLCSNCAREIKLLSWDGAHLLIFTVCYEESNLFDEYFHGWIKELLPKKLHKIRDEWESDSSSCWQSSYSKKYNLV